MIKLEDLPLKLQEQAKQKLNMQAKAAPYNKYGAVKSVSDNIKFDSKKEAARYNDLKMMEKSGVISDLVLQPSFVLQDGFYYKGKKERAIRYIADFSYMRDGKKYVEDVKGLKTDVYRIKRKLFLRQYGADIEFREI